MPDREGVMVVAVCMLIGFLVMVFLTRGTDMCDVCAWPWGRRSTDSAERILAERLARGEIDVEEYERRRQVIESTTRPADIPERREPRGRSEQ